MVVRISRGVLEQILEQARGDPWREVCGLLLGVGNSVTACRPAANVASDPAQRFEMDPAVLLAAHREARSGSVPMVGHYHSHPSGSIEPSPYDADMANADGMLWLICSGDDYAVWRASEDGLHGRFRPIKTEIMPV